MKVKKTDVATIQTSTSLSEFDKLPVAKPKEKKDDDVLSDFLAKADQVEKEEREAEKKKDSPSIRAAHKQSVKIEAEPVVKDDMLDNPISAMTAMNHPEYVEKAH